MEVQVGSLTKNNATQMSDLIVDSGLNYPIDIHSDNDESIRMSYTSILKTKTSTTKKTTGTTGSCTTTDITKYKLIAAPTNLTSSDWWKQFQIFHRNIQISCILQRVSTVERK